LKDALHVEEISLPWHDFPDLDLIFQKSCGGGRVSKSDSRAGVSHIK